MRARTPRATRRCCTRATAPGGVAVLVEALTDNRNRTGSDVRHAFSKHGGSLGEPGSVAYLFDKKGVIVVDAAAYGEDDLMVAIDAGAEDIAVDDDVLEVVTEPADFAAVRAALEAAGIAFESAEVTFRPTDARRDRRADGREAHAAHRHARGQRRRRRRARELRGRRRGPRARRRRLTAPMAPALPEVLRAEPRYRLLFAGQVLSVIGDRITFIALPFAVLAIGDLSDLALVTAALALPFLVVAIPGGTVADRVGRRETMLAADLGRAVVQAVMAVLLLTGSAEIWMLAVLAALFGVCESFFGPAMVGLIPQTVETARLQQANALFGLVQNVGHGARPGARRRRHRADGTGGGDRDRRGDVPRQRRVPRAAAARGAGGRGDPGEEGPHGVLGGLREGWGIVRAARWILPGIGALVAYTVFVLPSIFVLGPVLAESDLGGATAWAVISTAFGVGAVAGSVIAYRVRVERTLVVCFAAMLLASSQGAILASGLGVPAIAALECVAGVGVSLFFTLWDLTVQQQVPPEATSRISAYDWAAAVGLAPIGLALSGPIAGAIGVQETMRLGTVVGILAALACLAVPAVRAVRRPPDAYAASGT